MSEQPDPIELPALRGSVAIITGAANNGIGWGLCRYVAGELGMHVVLVDLHAQPVREAQARLQAEFDAVTCVGVQADVTDPAALAAWLRSRRMASDGTSVTIRVPDLLAVPSWEMSAAPTMRQSAAISRGRCRRRLRRRL